MRELVFLEDESTETFFVLRDEEGVRYQLAREELAPLLIDDSPAPEEPATDTEVAEEEQPAQPVAPAPELC